MVHFSVLGNAKTIRNDNSSRFGKFIQVCFDERFHISGCIIQDYLLEMSRITFQAANERNYHVFYQLVAGAMKSPELKARWLLERHDAYEYINQSGCYTLDGIDDVQMFDSLRRALIVLNVSDDMSDGIFSAVSAVLWIGNFQFEGIDDGEASRLTSKDYTIADKVATLLGIKTDQVVQVATHRQILVRGQITEIPLKLHEVSDSYVAKTQVSFQADSFAGKGESACHGQSSVLSNICLAGQPDQFLHQPRITEKSIHWST